MNFLWRMGATLGCAWLAACATTPAVAPTPAPAFELAGRIAARYQERGFTSTLRWKQGAGSDEIWLTAPLGQTIAYLQADAAGATLTGADQRQYHASSIENLTKSALGWRLPVAGLRYWVLGRQAPGMTVVTLERDDAQRVTLLRQDEWQIEFNYAGPDAMRPTRVEIAGNDAKIRLVIDGFSAEQP